MKDGEKLRKIRIRKDFTQEYLALKLGKSQKTISDLEHLETIEPQKLNELCMALEFTKTEFDNFVGDMVFESKHKEVDYSIVRYLLQIVEEQTEIINGPNLNLLGQSQ